MLLCGGLVPRLKTTNALNTSLDLVIFDVLSEQFISSSKIFRMISNTSMKLIICYFFTFTASHANQVITGHILFYKTSNLSLPCTIICNIDIYHCILSHVKPAYISSRFAPNHILILCIRNHRLITHMMKTFHLASHETHTITTHTIIHRHANYFFDTLLPIPHLNTHSNIIYVTFKYHK